MSEPRSRCCEYPLRVQTSGQGPGVTSFYVCTKCQKPADPAQYGPGEVAEHRAEQTSLFETNPEAF